MQYRQSKVDFWPTFKCVHHTCSSLPPQPAVQSCQAEVTRNCKRGRSSQMFISSSTCPSSLKKTRKISGPFSPSLQQLACTEAWRGILIQPHMFLVQVQSYPSGVYNMGCVCIHILKVCRHGLIGGFVQKAAAWAHAGILQSNYRYI